MTIASLYISITPLPAHSPVCLGQDGDPLQPLQKGEHVEYRTWRDKEGTLMAVRVERIKERTRPTGVAGGAGVVAQRRTDRGTQAHFR